MTAKELQEYVKNFALTELKSLQNEMYDDLRKGNKKNE